MVRPLLALFGVVTALFPQQVLAIFEAFALENPAEAERRPWVTQAMRGEGIVILVVSVFGRRSYRWMHYITGIFGVVLALSPAVYGYLGQILLYENHDTVRWNPRSFPVLRVLGIGYVKMAVRVFRRHRVSK